jgi:serine protease inhibitor
MKFFAKIALSTALLSAVYGCESEQVAQETDLKAIGTEFSTVSSDFGLELWKQVDATEKNKNYFVSPLSLHVALGMLLNGADGNTATEMKQTLKVSGMSDEQINATYAKIIENMPIVDKKVTTTMANSIWARKGIPFAQSFLDQNKKAFNAGIYSEDFDDATLKKINKWAADNTNNKIKEVLKEITPAQVMFLMNALYFKGDWKVPFNSKETGNEEFVGVSGKKTVKMMNLREKFGYATNDRFSALELPYGDGKFNMTIILPKGTATAEQTLSGFTINDWRALQKMDERKVFLKLPKFTLDYEIQLNNVLKNMGMKTAFDKGNWLKMAGTQALADNLKLSFVKQNTFIAVDEVGTEAAAVTTIGIELTSAPIEPEFFCNKPFLFVIHEKTSGQVMFVGKILNL